MRKILLTAIILLTAYKANAIMKEEFNYIPFSSYTDVATAGTIMFTSATVQFVGVTIASPSNVNNSYIAFFRSTSPVFTPNVATQTLVTTDYSPINATNQFIPMFEMKNDSYTYINKVGNAKVTIWLRCIAQSKGRVGTCPGLPWSGLREAKIEYP